MHGAFYKYLVHLVVIGFALTTGTSFANEPINLSTAKKQAIVYHDSGAYDNDIRIVMNQAMLYLKNRIKQPFTPGKKPAIVLDIDETSLSNYTDMKHLDFGGTIKDISRDEDKGTDPAIQPTLALYRFAMANHIAVIFLTGRHDYERKPTEANLKKVGYTLWDHLILRHGEYHSKPAVIYKTAMRKQLTERGYDIILNIGDQHSDLAGGYAEKTFKLPNPYYLIP